VHVYWVDNPAESEEVVRAKARRVVDYVVSLDANSVAVSLPLFTRGPTASDVFTTKSTPSPERVRILLEEARRSRLRVTLRPLLDERSLIAADPKGWRGKIQPDSRDRWFASYGRLVAPYLEVAEESGARTFVIGAELSSLEGDPRWAALVRQAGRRFRGEIAYSVNWDSWVSGPTGVPVRQLGVDAYFPVRVSDDASVSALVAGWNEWLDRRRTGALDGLLLYEVGAPAEDGAYHHPGVWGSAGGRLNLAVQERWFQAVCGVARARRMAGVYWWKLDFHTDPAAADPRRDVHDSFVGRPGEQAIRSCFSAWADASR
jgi:hypothetical protein